MEEIPFLVSIIIPVHNVEPYITRCAHSVFAQTYPNIEYIFVDDCSRDDSLRVLNDIVVGYPNKQPMVNIVQHPFNKGAAAARNTGLQIARGEYIYFLDSDDEIPKDCIELLTGLALSYDVEMVQGNFRSIPDGWCPHHIDHYDQAESSTDRDWIVKALLSGAILPMMACNRLVRRNWIIENKLYFKEGFMHEDDHWNFFLSKYLSSIAICKVHTYMYYRNPTGVMNSPSNKVFSADSFKAVLEDWVQNIGETHRKIELDFIFRRAFMYYESSEFSDFEFLEYIAPLFHYGVSLRVLKLVYTLRKKRLMPVALLVVLSKGILKLEKRRW